MKTAAKITAKSTAKTAEESTPQTADKIMPQTRGASSKKIHTRNLANHFLLATGKLSKSVFADTVIYICRHDKDGAFGLVLNKPSDTSVRELLESLKISPARDGSAVLHGGPVKPEQVFILHSPPGKYNVTIRVDDNIGLTMSNDILSDIADNRAPDKMQFAFGYAAWDGGQLESEIHDNAWLAVRASADIIFDLPPPSRFGEVTRRLGFDIRSLSSDTGHA